MKKGSEAQTPSEVFSSTTLWYSEELAVGCANMCQHVPTFVLFTVVIGKD